MRVDANESCPLPEDRVLAEVAGALGDAGDWAWIVDRNWRVVYVTNDHRQSFTGGSQMVPIVIGEHMFGPDALRVCAEWPIGPNRPELWRERFSKLGGLVLADTPGGKGGLREQVDPALADLVEDLKPVAAAAASGLLNAVGTRAAHWMTVRALRIRDDAGKLRGTAIQYTPAVGMAVMGSMVFERDPGHLQRMRSMARAGRRPAAILFADLEGSSALARTLSTGNYFAVGRRLVLAADQCVLNAGGLVGRHVGDGIVAFFPSESFDSESRAAQACISAARAVQMAMNGVASRSGLAMDDLVMRFGLHWGSTLYIGNISTTARTEVTALGDEVNETARIEACATGGRILASKPLIERLNDEDARGLAIDRDQIAYTQLAALDSATDKARRDAPAIAVSEL